MTRTRVLVAVGFTLSLGLSLFTTTPHARAVAADTLPARFTDAEFWKLTEDFSEPNGYFQSDNLLSNEIGFQYIIPNLLTQTGTGGVYMGVGPEQNFTYIVAIKPKLVFITDIRRGNLHTQLMYKALFELSADRADFVSMLFTKKRPAGLTTKSTAVEIFNAFWNVDSSPDAAYKANLQAIDDQLTKKHGWPLSKEDLDGIEYVYHNFYWYGPSINYSSSTQNGTGRGGGGNYVSYYDLMTATDQAGLNRAFLASEENFKVMKDLEEKNLLVPFVGDFAGPKALRAEGKWLKEHGAQVTAFYLSNVEQYLTRNNVWSSFCSNFSQLPLTEKSTFIYSEQGGGGGGRGGGLSSTFRAMLPDTKLCGFASQPLGFGVRMGR